MSTMNNGKPASARIEESGDPLLIAGLSERYNFGSPMDIASQWEQFVPYVGAVPGQKSAVVYGLCLDLEGGEGIEYLCGVEVTDAGNLPEAFSHEHLPAHTFAVFEHEGDVSTLRQTIGAVWNERLQASDLDVDEEAGFFFERYGEDFDPETGTGQIEIWVPIEESQ